MNKFFVFVLCCFTAFLPCSSSTFTKYVNPFIGTGAVDGGLSGNCYPGPTVPFGMVQPSPDTREVPNWDCAPGYDYNDNTIYGFSHTRLSGTGVSDLIDILLMPTSASGEKIPSSHFSHDDEEARPGYYRVRLHDSGINAELSCTNRCAIHRYSLLAESPLTLFVDIDHSSKKGDWNRHIIQSQLRLISPTVLEGYRVITGWAKLRKVYFHIEFSAPVVSHVFQSDGVVRPNSAVVNGHQILGWLQFALPQTSSQPDAQATSPNAALTVKVALSPVSIENARLNMQAEASSWNFDDYVLRADNQWNDLLQAITVEGGTDEQRQIFYTALYHTLIQPNTISDACGDYMAPDYTIRRLPAGQTCYSTFSIWDTYRAAHPLYNLICPKRNAEFIASMLLHCDSYGYLPVWHLWGQENYCMIGNHAVSILAEAINKEIPGIDAERCYQAIRQTLTTPHPNSPWDILNKYGYIPEDLQSQSVSLTLELAYDDWCAAQVALRLGHTDDYEFFMHRSQSYHHLFNPLTRFFQGRTSNGQWLPNFDPLQYGANGGNPFTEGNAWQWLWYVPHDIRNLVTMMGGKKAFEERLDQFFTTDDRSGQLNSNASGFIGQYIHGNEPDHHVAYLYDYIGKPHKTQQIVSRIMNQMYNTRHDGYAGNDDCGEMSAWYVFSALGFYPVCPASTHYAIGSPIFPRATLRLQNGHTFTVIVHRKHPGDFIISRQTLNSQPHPDPFLSHEEIMEGGTLEVWMTKQ